MSNADDFLHLDQIEDFRSCLAGPAFSPDDFELKQQREKHTGAYFMIPKPEQ